MLYVDSFAMLVVAFIAFNKRIGLQTKKILFSANFFLMSFALVLYLGFEGNGTILLFVLNVLITLYSGRKAGLDSVIITAVFKPFYQVDIKNKKALHGSGVGLTIAKAYVEMLGGVISLESEEGVGSTFWFIINTNLK